MSVRKIKIRPPAREKQRGVQFPPMGTKRMFWGSRTVIAEEVGNGTPVSIEAKRPRRRMKMILTLVLSGTLGGFLVSYVFPAKYTSQSTVLVEGQKIPDNYVAPIITSDFTQRIQAISQLVLSPGRLRPVIQSLNLVKPDEEGKLIEDIQQNVLVEPVITAMTAAVQAGTSDAKKETSASEPVPGFNVIYTDNDAARAQKICNAVTSLILDENLRSRAEVIQGITEFLSRQLAEAKNVLDEQDAKLAAFKKQYMGKLPTDTRTAMSPSVEEQYKLLTRDNDNNEAFYKDLLAKKNSAALSASMENQQLGEQMYILAAAGLPEAPSFPERPLFALWGLGAGLLLGLGRILWPAARKLFQRLALLFPTGTESE
jgi:uncharacterized protein involved in exopolysaccharide biosynthesis